MITPKHVYVYVYVYVPATFDASNFPELDGLHDEAHWLLHKIVTGASHRKHDAEFNGMVHIHSQTIEHFTSTRNASTVKKALINGGVIVIDKSYEKANPAQGIEGYSMSYGLAEAYAGDLRRVRVEKDTLAAKILAHRCELQNRPVDQLDLDHTLDHLNHWLRKLKIDTRKAFDIIENTPNKPARVVRVKIGPRHRRKFVRVAIPDSRALNRMVVETIDDGDPEWHVCQYGRVHTPVTRLMTDCRQCLTIDGQPLVGADIRNSQVVFLMLLLIEQRAREAGEKGAPKETTPALHRQPYGKGLTTLRSRQKRRTSPTHPLCSVSQTGQKGTTDPKTAPQTQPAPSHPLCSVSSDPVNADQFDHFLMDDERTFKARVLNGSLYDHLMGLTGYTDRRKFKADFFAAVLYGDPSAYYSYSSPVKRAFAATYPTVWSFVLEMKSWDRKTGAKGDAFKRLAREMQRRESRFVIGRVCGRFAAHHPDVPLITVHDSIMSTPQHMPTVLRIMREEFLRIGVSPAIKVEGEQQQTNQKAA